jgi:HAD superfamily hydrolase (TIGR01458 family)
MQSLLKDIKGYLIDLDGVLYVGDEPIDGAIKTIDFLKSNNIPYRFVTNTTTKSLDTLHGKIQEMGLPIEKEDIVSAPKAAVLHLRKIGSPVCYLSMNDDVRLDFSEFETSNTNPEVVVIGDIDDEWNYDIMSRLFHMIINGADIVALHKGRYWHEPDGLRLDIGPFVAGLEYATGKEATVIGKPNTAFFEMAVDDMALKPSKVAMIGDDINSDIGGAQKAGLKGILVKTGKYREELVGKSAVRPDIVLDSIAQLRDMPDIAEADMNR